MQVEDILFQGFAFHDLHSPPRTNSWNEEVVHRTQKAEEDHYTDHEHHLYHVMNIDIIYHHAFYHTSKYNTDYQDLLITTI